MPYKYSIRQRGEVWRESGKFETKLEAKTAIEQKLEMLYPKNWGLNLLEKYIILKDIDRYKRNTVLGEVKHVGSEAR